MNVFSVWLVTSLSLALSGAPGDFQNWQFRPYQINGGQGFGWEVEERYDEVVPGRVATASESQRSFYWRVYQDIYVGEQESVSLRVRVTFNGAPYDWFRVLVGPDEATRMDQFAPLYTLSNPGRIQEEVIVPLTEYSASDRFRVMLAVRKPYAVVSEDSPFTIHELEILRSSPSGIVTEVLSVPPVSEPEPEPEPVLEPEPEPAPAPLPTAEAVEDLKIASFNVQVFGQSKLAKTPVRRALVRIIDRYDLLLFQEIRDQSEQAIYSLLAELNQESEHPYDIIVSGRMGSTDMKEQYAYFFRTDRLRVSGDRTYAEGDRRKQRKFERPPFMGHFESLETGFDFVAVGVHVDPDTAEDEIDSLVEVYEEAKDFFGDPDVLLMGDFNADCQYLREGDFEDIRLWTDGRFHWLIDNDDDTTTGKNTCAFDRFVCSTPLKSKVVHNSADVFRFDSHVRLPVGGVKKISDHYPIEMRLRL